MSLKEIQPAKRPDYIMPPDMVEKIYDLAMKKFHSHVALIYAYFEYFRGDYKGFEGHPVHIDNRNFFMPYDYKIVIAEHYTEYDNAGEDRKLIGTGIWYRAASIIFTDLPGYFRDNITKEEVARIYDKLNMHIFLNTH